ncbi:putative longitudinals lacking protein, isoform G-like isoform X24 [Penaeus vannamei]|uniref:Putative longitudinals lacking protein, isoform G-like isoform X24 n=1 Tax=Penaeus vannamei TaxID=6689 RepID=A0A3R7QKW1_PENVA|nr:putative longitudinals lacking protein, isoform G-like isoform X24 [Penaeus vannamei]
MRSSRRPSENKMDAYAPESPPCAYAGRALAGVNTCAMSEVRESHLAGKMVDQQQFCLRWNNHGSTLVAVFENLLASESLVDVTLFAEGKLFKAHKVVLSACSPYFQTLFAQTIDKHPIVILKDVKHVELKALLDYMYRGEVNVSQDQLGPLIKTAESLKIKGLADGSNKAEGGDTRATHPAGHDVPKTENSLDSKSGRSSLDAFPTPPVSVPSVLSTVLTMPPALSLASSTLVPPIKLPNLATTTVTDPTPREDGDSPHTKRRKRMRRKSGEGGDSGDSDGRSSGSPGDGIHLPRIPATITPIAALHSNRDQHQQHKERSSRGDSHIDIPRSSPASRPDSDPRSSSPSKALSLLVRPDENSSDANHQSDDEYEERNHDRPSHDQMPDTPGPSTSRLLTDDAPHTPSYMWPYPPDTSASDDSSFPSLENNQGIWKNKFLAPYLGSPLAPIPPRSHPGLGSPFPGLYGPPPTSPWGRHSPPTPTLSAPQLMRSNECSRCGRLYKTRKGLKHHIKNECGVEPRFQCIHCDWKFKQKAHLLRHVARKHTAS